MNTKHTKIYSVTWELNSQVRRIALAIVVLVCALAAAPLAHAATLGQANATSLSSGLVGYWSMDGATTNWLTGITRDLSGQGKNGSLTGMSTTTSPVAGKVGQGLNFPGGTGHYISNFSSSISPAGSSRTSCAWFNTTSTAREGIFGTRGSTGGGFVLTLNSGSVGRITYFHTGGTTLNFSAGITTNKWYQVCAVLNATTNFLSIYLNGVLIGGPSAVSAEGATTFNGIIGDEDFSGGTTFKGVIDDVRMYNRVLSSSEISQLYTQGTANISHSSNVPLSSGLVDYYPLDGNTVNWTSNFASDLGSGANNLTTFVGMNKTTSPVAGKMAGAIKLTGNGATQKMVSVSNVGISGTASRTLSAWVNLTSCVDPGGIVGWGNTSGSQYYLTCSLASSFHYALWTNGGASIDSGVSSRDGKWHFIATTYDGTNTRLYVDGVLKGTGTTLSGTTNTPLSINQEQLLITGVTGAIDDVRVYNRALSAAEVKQLYTLGAGTIAQSNPTVAGSGLVGYWTFDGPKINWATGAVADSSGQGNTGSLTAMSTSSSPVAGKVGSALKFNSSWVALPTGLNTGSVYSVSMWINMASTNTYVELFTQGQTRGFYWHQQKFGYSNGTDEYGTVLSLNTWHHVVGVVNGTAITLYTDGQPNGSFGTDGASFTQITVGGHPTAGGHFVNGKIDDVRLYNRALSAAEVTQLYNSSR